MKIDIVSDTVCPWCFIGKRRLERALATRPGVRPEITWRPYRLNPDMPAQGMDRRSYLEAKFGDTDQVRRMNAHMRDTGRDERIDFAFERIGRSPNTLNSHRLIHFAQRHGCQTALVEELFLRYFERGEDIGDPAVLAAAGGAVGLSEDDCAAYLASDEDADLIRDADERARRLGITGVPFFIIDNRYAISGAQAPEVFLRVFDLVVAESQADTTAQPQAEAEEPT